MSRVETLHRLPSSAQAREETERVQAREETARPGESEVRERKGETGTVINHPQRLKAVIL
jgi:hypothetical protein